MTYMSEMFDGSEDNTHMTTNSHWVGLDLRDQWMNMVRQWHSEGGVILGDEIPGLRELESRIEMADDRLLEDLARLGSPEPGQQPVFHTPFVDIEGDVNDVF